MSALAAAFGPSLATWPLFLPSLPEADVQGMCSTAASVTASLAGWCEGAEDMGAGAFPWPLVLAPFKNLPLGGVADLMATLKLAPKSRGAQAAAEENPAQGEAASTLSRRSSKAALPKARSSASMRSAGALSGTGGSTPRSLGVGGELAGLVTSWLRAGAPSAKTPLLMPTAMARAIKTCAGLAKAAAQAAKKSVGRKKRVAKKGAGRTRQARRTPTKRPTTGGKGKKGTTKKKKPVPSGTPKKRVAAGAGT